MTTTQSQVFSILQEYPGGVDHDTLIAEARERGIPAGDAHHALACLLRAGTGVQRVLFYAAPEGTAPNSTMYDLERVFAHGPLTVQQYGERVGMRPSAARAALSRLLQIGLVARVGTTGGGWAQGAPSVLYGLPRSAR